MLSKIKQSQPWTSHQDTLLDEMTSVAGDALENQRRSLLNDATTECKNVSRKFGATCQKFNKKSNSNRLREEKKLKDLAGESHYQNLYATNTSGA